MVSLCSVFLFICKARATSTVRHHFRNLRIVTNNLTHCAELKVLILNNFVWKSQIHVCFCVRIWKDRAYTIEWWILLVRFYEGTKRSRRLYEPCYCVALDQMWAFDACRCTFFQLSSAIYSLPSHKPKKVSMCLEQCDCSLWWKVHLCVIFGAENVEGQSFPYENRFVCQNIINLLDNWQTKPKANRIERGLNESELFSYHRVVTHRWHGEDPYM